MRVIKESEHSLLLNYFGLMNRYYLAITVMTYFDFTDPANPLAEREMWPFVQEELGKDAILDMAMPKPKGELLVWGRCFPPGGEPRGASQVSVRLGPIEKRLYVFGNRYWKKAGGMGYSITEPEPFIDMPLTYDRAFGGSGFDRNPLGRGAAPVTTSPGQQSHPLPNVEDPRRLIGSPADRPDPAGFAPIDYAWPQRAKKLGTYDNKWFQERWPFYPDDMNWTYFNTAPEDQQIEDFFAGTEAFSVAGMHPKEPIVESRLPGIRHRFFVNQLADAAKPEGETLFKEVLTHIDTVWLFPHAKKGIAISRGTAEVKDDEALDIAHLYVVSERVSEHPGTIEKYHEQFTKQINRALTPDISAQMEEAKKKLSAAADTLMDLPLQIKDQIAAHLGKAPKAVRTPVEVVKDSLALIDKQKQLLADSEKRILAAKSRFGHMIKIDTSGFAVAAKSLDEAKSKLSAVPVMLEDIAKKNAENMKELKGALHEIYDKSDFLTVNPGAVDADAILDMYKEKPRDLWQDSGMRFLERCREELMQDPDMMTAFRSLGLRPYTLKRAWVGLNRQEARFERAAWALKPGKDDADPDTLVIPAGLVIPRFAGAAIDTIMVRPIFGSAAASAASLAQASRDGSRDVPVEGSKGNAMVLGGEEGKPFVRFADELEALLARQELGDFCAFTAMRDPSAPVDGDPKKALTGAPQFLITVYPVPEGSAGTVGMESWKAAAGTAEPLALPKGRDLFGAKKAGVDIWQWIADALKPAVAPPPETKPKEVDVSEPGALAALVPVIDVKGLIKGVKDELMARIQPKLDLMAAKEKEAMDILRKEMAKKGISLDKMMAREPPKIPEGKNPYVFAQEKVAKDFQQIREKLTKQGTMNAEIEKKIAEAERSGQKILGDSAKLYDEGMKRLAADDAKVAAGTPDWAKKLLARAGIDPGDPNPLKPLTRDEVAERHARGLSLAGRNMAGADLSRLDLAGADLRKANLQKTNLAGAVLDGSDMSGALATEADFTKSSLRGVKMVTGIFQKAKFPGADMSRADMTGSMMSGADLTGTDLTGAIIVRTLLEKATLKNARAVDSLSSQIYLLSADVSGADFTGADLTKAVFLKTTIDEAKLSRSTLREAAFIESRGAKVDLSGADMHNSRILQGSAMTESDFTGTRADRSSWMKSDLSGGDFRGATVERALVEGCDLRGSDLSGVTAKQARFTKSNLSDSNLTQINLFQGSLRKSKLVRTDLRQANLYGAEFYRTGVGETKLDGANLKMTKLHKREELLPEPPKDGSDDRGRK